MRQIEARRFDKEGETSADGSAAAPVSQAEDEGEGGEVLAAAGEISEGEGESNGAGGEVLAAAGEISEGEGESNGAGEGEGEGSDDSFVQVLSQIKGVVHEDNEDNEGETSADGSAAAPVSQAEGEGEGESNGAGEGEGDFSYGDGTVESITVPCNGGGCKPTLASRGTTRQRVGLRGQQRAAGAARST